MTKEEALKDPEDAYWWARDNGPCDATRKVACKDAWKSFLYAQDVDEESRDDTRTGSCQNPEVALAYAQDIDKGFHEETWKAVEGTQSEEEYRESCYPEKEFEHLLAGLELGEILSFWGQDKLNNEVKYFETFKGSEDDKAFTGVEGLNEFYKIEEWLEDYTFVEAIKRPDSE